MAGERLSVVVTRRLPEAVETRMKELFDVELNEADTPMSKPELISAMNRADVLVPCIADRIDAGMLGQAGDRLKLIANYGAGVDHIDVSTARQRGILVSNTPGVMTDDTADMVMAASGWASSAWGGSGRLLHAVRRSLGCRCITITDGVFIRIRRPSLRQRIGKVSTR